MAEVPESDPRGEAADLAERDQGTRAGGAPRWGRRVLTGLIAAAAIGGFAMLVVYSYDRGKEAGGGSVAPVITAREGPTKIKPGDPGGMNVPDRDKQVFERLDPVAPKDKVEHLLPPPERVVAKPMPALPKEELELAPPPPPPPVAKQAAAPAPPPAPIAAPQAAMQPPAAMEEPAARAYRVQIASLRSEKAALAAWEEMRKEHRGLFDNLSPTVARAEVAGRGTFYRLQAGPLSDEAAARTLCAEAKKRKIGCLVVRP